MVEYRITGTDGTVEVTEKTIEESTIKYYFEESSESGYTWTTHRTGAEAESLKNSYAASMKKWNNVYFYDYDSSGIVTKRKNN